MLQPRIITLPSMPAPPTAFIVSSPSRSRLIPRLLTLPTSPVELYVPVRKLPRVEVSQAPTGARTIRTLMLADHIIAARADAETVADPVAEVLEGIEAPAVIESAALVCDVPEAVDNIS